MKSMRKLLAIGSLLLATSLAFPVGIGPIDNEDNPTTVTVFNGDQVHMEAEVFNGANEVVFKVTDSNGGLVYSGSDQPENGTVSFDWFPLTDGTFTVTTTSYLDGTLLGTETASLVSSVRPDASGFITGGGWYDLGQRNNFGFVAQVLGNGSIRGSLEFQDRVNSASIKSTSLDWVFAPDCRNGYFAGFCRMNNSGNYRFFCHVIDNGEPGSSDWLELWVYDSNGNLMWFHQGTLNGGNIQVHCRL